MESLLIGVTVVSLLLAVTMSVVAWTLIRSERVRAAARIEALEALAFESDSVETHRPLVKTDQAEAPHWDLALGGNAPALDLIDKPHWVHDDRRPSRSHADAMFDTSRPSPGKGLRWVAVGGVGLVIVSVYAWAALSRSPEVTSASRSTVAESVRGEQLPLELLSLRHVVEPEGGFTVSGLVQNPSGGRDLARLEAVVYLFDSEDQYFTSGRAHVDAAAVGPGTESSFEVRIPNVTGVTRYRVGFRVADGATVAHVDRRGHFPEGTTVDTARGPDVVRRTGGMGPVSEEAAR